MESKLWHLSDGDVIAVAAAVGHGPDAAAHHYLQLSDDMKAVAANFVGLALLEIPGQVRSVLGHQEYQMKFHFSFATLPTIYGLLMWMQ